MRGLMMEMPLSMVLVDSLPRTGVGKYQKNVLREKYKGYFEISTPEQADA